MLQCKDNGSTHFNFIPFISASPHKQDDIDNLYKETPASGSEANPDLSSDKDPEELVTESNCLE